MNNLRFGSNVAGAAWDRLGRVRLGADPCGYRSVPLVEHRCGGGDLLLGLLLVRR